VQNLFAQEFENRDHALFVSLAPDPQRGVVGRKVAAVDADQLGQTQSAGVKHQDDERVALGLEIFAVRSALADDGRHAAFGNECRQAA